MASESDNDMIREFSIEATDMLDQAESDLLSLDKGGEFKSLFDSIFRVFHSLKGGAGMLGLQPLQQHMHALENTLSSLKANHRLSSDETNFFLEGVDAGRQLLAGQSIKFNYEISISSTTGKILPSVASEPASKTPSNQLASKKDFKYMAYVIDDEPDILDNLCEILDTAKIQSRSFTNPLVALEEIRKSPPDIILTDMKMPQMSGLTLLRQVHEENPDIPVILISGYITTESLLAALESGVFAAIEKPFKVDVVLTYCLAAVKQHQTFKMFRRGLNLLLYQFSDLEDFLKSHGKIDVANTARSELLSLLSQWKELSSKKIVKNLEPLSKT